MSELEFFEVDELLKEADNQIKETQEILEEDKEVLEEQMIEEKSYNEKEFGIDLEKEEE